MSKKERLHLIMPPETREKIDDIQERIRATTMSEVIRRSLSLLDILTREQAKGSSIYVRGKDGREKEILIT